MDRYLGPSDSGAAVLAGKSFDCDNNISVDNVPLATLRNKRIRDRESLSDSDIDSPLARVRKVRWIG